MPFQPTIAEQAQIDAFLASLATAETAHKVQHGRYRRVRQWGGITGLEALGVANPATVLVKVDEYVIGGTAGYVVTFRCDHAGDIEDRAYNFGPAAMDVWAHDWRPALLPAPMAEDADVLVAPYQTVADVDARIASIFDQLDPDHFTEVMALIRRRTALGGN